MMSYGILLQSVLVSRMYKTAWLFTTCGTHKSSETYYLVNTHNYNLCDIALYQQHHLYIIFTAILALYITLPIYLIEVIVATHAFVPLL